jgi:CheY-like chemotaxis protein
VVDDRRVSKRPSVLVVDDDEATCDALATILRGENYAVVTALRAAEGLRVMRDGVIDVVILDLVMPEMDGWAFVEALRGDPSLSATPVLVMTAHGPAVLATAPVAAGYFKKPIVLDRFLEVLQRTLTLRRGSDPATRN